MRYVVKVPQGDPRYEMDLDLRERALHVYLANGVGDDKLEFAIASEDEFSLVDFKIGHDELPVILGVSIFDPNKVSIIQDWIEEAIDAAMNNLNSFREDNYEENHWKGCLLGPRE